MEREAKGNRKEREMEGNGKEQIMEIEGKGEGNCREKRKGRE